MSMKIMSTKTLLATALFATVAAFAVAPASAQEAVPPKEMKWSFDGPFGTYDRAALQRGFQVYKEICSTCHAMKYLHYRDLSGIGLSDDQIKALASSYQITDGPNDQGEMFERAGRPSDTFKSPFANDQAARAANNNALPKDLSIIVKGRAGGENYIYSLLTGFDKTPAGVTVPQGLYYNTYFPGHNIAMPPPLSAGAVNYTDGTPSSVEQMASDVTTFLTWASNPDMEERKGLGLKVMAFLVLFTGLMFAVKRKVWSDVH
jgi:ubiquinol-cytochrome c reductase cytochrome c1 subunit